MIHTMAELTSAERVMRVIRNEEPDRIPHFEWIIDKQVRHALCPGSTTEEFTVRMGLDAMLTSPDFTSEQVAPNRFRNEWGIVVEKGVEQGSEVRTDGWVGYNGLNRLGYVHQRVREEGQVGDNLLPSCHRVSGLLKRWLLGTHQGAVSHEHLDYYLDEFTFRFNRRTSRHRGKLFYRLLQQAMAVEPVPIKSMVKHARGQKPRHNI